MPWITPHKLRFIRAARADGHTMEAIASFFHVGRRTLYDSLYRQGVQLSPTKSLQTIWDETKPQPHKEPA